MINLKGRQENHHASIDERPLTYEQLDLKYSKYFSKESGGHWKPIQCESHNKVALIGKFVIQKVFSF